VQDGVEAVDLLAELLELLFVDLNSIDHFIDTFLIPFDSPVVLLAFIGS
jgi:hypothetical protein